MLLNTNPMKDTPSDGLVKGDWEKKSGHAYMLEGVAKDNDGNVMLTLRNPWGTNNDPTQGVHSTDPHVTVNLKDIIQNGHLESIDIGPAATQKREQTKQQDQPSQPEPYKVQTGDPYMDKLLNSNLDDPVAFKQAVNDLSNSPAGQAFRAEGQAMYLEQQNQQLQTKVAEQQTQIQAQAQVQVQTGPVMTR